MTLRTGSRRVVARQALHARSSITCFAVLGFGDTGRLTVGTFAPDAVTSVTTGGQFAWRARASGLRFSACSSWLHSRQRPSRLTSRSSRRRISASLKLAGVRAILAPLCRVRRGLTQALGGEKRSVVVLFASAALWLRSAWLFGQVLGPLPLRSSSSGALKHHVLCGHRLRKP